jgi:hypothetical protein
VIAAGVIQANELLTPLVWIEHWPKESTRMATRYEKRAVNYRAKVVIAAFVIWLTA